MIVILVITSYKTGKVKITGIFDMKPGRIIWVEDLRDKIEVIPARPDYPLTIASRKDWTPIYGHCENNK